METKLYQTHVVGRGPLPVLGSERRGHQRNGRRSPIGSR